MNLKQKLKRKRQLVLPMVLFLGILGGTVLATLLLSNTESFTWNVSATAPIEITKMQEPQNGFSKGIWYNNSIAFQLDNYDRENGYAIDLVFKINATGINTSHLEMNVVFDRLTGITDNPISWVQDGANDINATLSTTLEPYGPTTDNYIECYIEVRFDTTAPVEFYRMDIWVVGDVA